MNDELFIKLQGALDALKEDEVLSYVGEDWGQLDYYDKHPPVKFRCALYDIGQVDFADRGQRTQQGKGTINLRIADYKPVQVSSGSPDNLKPLEMYQALRAVYVAVQGLQGETFSPLTRTRCSRIIRDDGVREYVMSFSFGYVDTAAQKRTHTVPATPRITVTQEKSPGN